MLEPLPDYAPELSALEQPGRIDYVRAAAGRFKDDLPLFIPDEPGGSSFLPASRQSDTHFKRSVIVPVIPLSSLGISSTPALLKLDVQGFELEVLAGAKSMLNEIEVVIAECSLYPFQENIPLIDQVVRDVAELGYCLYDTADEYRWPSGTLAQVDVIFVRYDSHLLEPKQWT